MTVVNKTRLKTSHRKWLRRILHVAWRDEISNETTREWTGEDDLYNIIRKRRLKSMEHSVPRDKGHTANQAIFWSPGEKGKEEDC